tara:strand:+ start:623 stop:871 length:249 start_codon:yes stop_codon:yes gene_type:complete
MYKSCAHCLPQTTPANQAREGKKDRFDQIFTPAVSGYVRSSTLDPFLKHRDHCATFPIRGPDLMRFWGKITPKAVAIAQHSR